MRLIQTLMALAVMLALLCGAMAATTQAQDARVGLAPYSIMSPRWPCKQYMRAFRGVPEIRFSWLWRTFGEEKGCVTQLLQNQRTKAAQIYLLNSVGHRNRRLGNYEFLKAYSVQEWEAKLRARDPKLLSRYREYARAASDFLRANLRPGVACYVAPELEGNTSAQAFKVLAEVTKEVFPNCQIVRSVFRQPAVAPYHYERHETNARLQAPCVWSNDGIGIKHHGQDSNLASNVSSDDVPALVKRFAKCDNIYLWNDFDNAICKGGFVDPRKRTCWPTKEKIAATNKMLRELYEKPVVVPPPSEEDEAAKKKCRKVNRSNDGAGGFLWKPLSDVRPSAVALLPGRFKEKFKQVELIKGKKVLERLIWSGFGNDDKDGPRHHWRSTRKGSSLPKHTLLKADGQCWPLADPGSRLD